MHVHTHVWQCSSGIDMRFLYLHGSHLALTQANLSLHPCQALAVCVIAIGVQVKTRLCLQQGTCSNPHMFAHRVLLRILISQILCLKILYIQLCVLCMPGMHFGHVVLLAQQL